MKKIILSAVFLITVMLLFTVGKKDAIAQEAPQQQVQGNTDFNLRSRNWGLVAAYKDDIYYFDYQQVKLRKLDSSGEITDILSNYYVRDINIINDKIYFIRLIDNKYHIMDGAWQIFVMDLNGKNMKMLSIEDVYGIRVIDKYIYYDPAANPFMKSRFSRMDLDGKNKKRLFADESYQEIVTNDSIYFLSNTETGYYSLYKSDLDGKNIELIAEDISDMAIEGDWVYYIDHERVKPYGATICKMKLDGTEKSKIFSFDDSLIVLLGVDDGYIYIQGYNFTARVNTDGDDYKSIFGEQKPWLNNDKLLIAGGYIFYYDYNNGNSITKIKLTDIE